MISVSVLKWLLEISVDMSESIIHILFLQLIFVKVILYLIISYESPSGNILVIKTLMSQICNVISFQHML